VDTSSGMGMCFSLSAYCIGKADATDAPPPWETENGNALEEITPTPDAAGCAVAGHDASGALPLALLLGLLAWRRRAAK